MALRKQIEPKQGLGGIEGGTAEQPSPWTSFSGAPVGSEGVSQEPKESMPTSLLACMFHVGF